MVVNTFAHPYVAQVVALWLSFLPIAAMAGVMTAAVIRGDRGKARLTHIRAPR